MADKILMRALVTHDGTAASECGVCAECWPDESVRAYARHNASESDDVDPDGEFHDVSGNDAVPCCNCGKISVDGKLIEGDDELDNLLQLRQTLLPRKDDTAE